jgi:hypothetical protein
MAGYTGRDNPPDADGVIRNYLTEDDQHVPPQEVLNGQYKILSQDQENGRGLPRINYRVAKKG